jgi:hypothetical protein|tara:strand:+ start:3964 stop:4998 length:1035 start_codon:yes stop_codon:yes gene_type:complete
MAYTTINKSTEHFNTKLYTGNGSTGNAQTGVGFQPDLTWIKNRSDSNPHCWTDAVRGATKYIESDTTDTEDTNTEFLQSFNSDGFTVGNSGRVNTNGNNYASWNWKANGQGSANTTGTINSSYTSANTTSGFSIVTYTGTGTAGTIGHGLGAVPTMIITKSLNYAEGWYCYHVSLGNGASIVLNTTGISYSSSNWNNTTPTSSVFSVGTGDTNTSGRTYVAYCFANKTGFSKAGYYYGNGNADGTFAYTGFKPTWIMGKKVDGATNNWYLFDSARDTFNLTTKKLRPDTTAVENDNSSKAIDILSNGFKIKNTDAEFNNSGDKYIYLAFGQSLVGSNNVPCTAR